MPEIVWIGAALSGEWERALAARNVVVHRSQPAADGLDSLAVNCVASSRGTRAPDRPSAAPWIWVSHGAVAPEEEVAAIAAGAYDVIVANEKGALARLLDRLDELATKEADPPESPGFIAESPAMRAALRAAARAARTSMPVLITGDTGTGKELVAHLVHEWSARATKRFVPINCAAIPNELIEAELFGYTRGAFSGAVRAYDGQISAAEGGTVFLDEIDDTPPTLQVKLLRVLEDRVVSRLGENQWRRVDFRIVAATNRDLEDLIARGAFGKDLYERLAIARVHLPGLRERTADLPVLAMHFVRRFFAEEPAAAERQPVERVSRSALAALGAYPWPGNVRELRNVIYEALIGKKAGKEILMSDLPPRIFGTGSPRQDEVIRRDVIERRIADGSMNLRAELEALERAALETAMRRAGGRPARAARLLGEVGRGAARDPGGTVRAMLRRLGM